MTKGAGSKSGAEPLAGKKILVIEDEFLIALDIETTLRNAGAAAVELASDVEDALQKIASGTWDLAITDNNLEGRSCQALVATFHAKRVPFLVLTGYAPQQLPRDLGAAPILTKPFAPKDLVASLCNLCK